MSYRSYCFASAACAGLLMGAWSTAAAAQASATVGDVVVTGQRQHYRGDIPVKELPQAVQVISAKILSQQAITRLPEALDLAAGVARQNSFGGVWDAFAIRGFAGDINVPSGYLVNGFNARGFAGLRDTSSVERIEVLKGPGSALFGQGEPGGTVYISTKKPLFKPAGSLSASAGSYAFYRGEGDFTTPITEDVAVRINGAVERGRSFRDTVKTKRYFLSPSVLWKLGSSTSVSYELELSKQDLPFDRGVVAFNRRVGYIPISRYLGEPGDGPMTARAVGHQVELQHNFNSDWTLLAGFSQRYTQLNGFGQTPELVAGRQPFFSTGTILSRQRRFTDYETFDTILRAEISGKFEVAGFTNHLLFGGDFDRFKFDRFQTRFRPPVFNAGLTLAQINGVNVFNPVYGNLPNPNAFVFRDVEHDRSFGFYATDQIDLTDKLKVRFGGRWDKYKQRIDDRLTPLQPPRQDIHAFSPQAGIIFEPTRDLTFYVAYAKGFRPNSGFDVRRNPFAPEKTQSAEVGVKFEALDGHVRGTLAAYTMKKTNVITADPVNQGFSLAIGKAKSRGVELDTSGDLPGGVNFQFAYAYTDAFSAADVREPDFGKLVAKGDPLLNVPKHNASLLLSKDFEVAQRKLTVGGMVKYVSKRLGETGTTFFLPSYTTVNFNAAYEITDHLEVSAQVRNAFNKEYYPASFATLWVIPGEPREYMARISYRF